MILEYFWMGVWTLCLFGATVAAEYYLPNAFYAYPLGLGLSFLFAANRAGPSNQNVATYLRVYGHHMDLPRFERLRLVLLKLPPMAPATNTEGSKEQ